MGWGDSRLFQWLEHSGAAQPRLVWELLGISAYFLLHYLPRLPRLPRQWEETEGGHGGGAGGPRAEKGATAIRARTLGPLWPAAFWWLSTPTSVFWNNLSTFLLCRKLLTGCHLQGSKPRLKGILWLSCPGRAQRQEGVHLCRPTVRGCVHTLWGERPAPGRPRGPQAGHTGESGERL